MRTKVTSGATWQVCGLTRATAEEVSQVGGRPAYGGSPSDLSVVRAIEDLKARGLKVAARAVRDDGHPGGERAARSGDGRRRAAGLSLARAHHLRPGAGPAGLARQDSRRRRMRSRRSSARRSRAISRRTTGGIAYSGPDGVELSAHGAALRASCRDGGRRRRVPHRLGAARADDAPLGDEHLSVRGGAEGARRRRAHGGRRRRRRSPMPRTGANISGISRPTAPATCIFHLDPLWADAEIDFVGIDLYHPLTDWRDEPGHSDEASGRSPYDLDYLRGEYPRRRGVRLVLCERADRAAQIRTPITDGAYGKPWVFRFKDIEAWWANAHHDRPGGVEAATPTEWVPQGKPIWLTELGCPAVDKGANQPNVFFDPKSAESALPYFSSGARDDFQQRAYHRAYQRFFDADHPGFDGSNPVSPVYGGRMIDPAHLHLWAWDARPYPYFPDLTDVWSDGANWERGHWLNGRLGAASLAGLIAAVLRGPRLCGLSPSRTCTGWSAAMSSTRCFRRAPRSSRCCRRFGSTRRMPATACCFAGWRRPARCGARADELVERADEPLVRGAARRRRSSLRSWCSASSTRQGLSHGRGGLAAARRRKPAQRRRSTSPRCIEFSEAERLTDALLARHLGGARARGAAAAAERASAIEAGDVLRSPGGAQAELLLAERIEDGREPQLAAPARRSARAGAAARGGAASRREPALPGRAGGARHRFRAARRNRDACAAARGLRRAVAGHDRDLCRGGGRRLPSRRDTDARARRSGG